MKLQTAKQYYEIRQKYLEYKKEGIHYKTAIEKIMEVYPHLSIEGIRKAVYKRKIREMAAAMLNEPCYKNNEFSVIKIFIPPGLKVKVEVIRE